MAEGRQAEDLLGAQVAVKTLSSALLQKEQAEKLLTAQLAVSLALVGAGGLSQAAAASLLQGVCEGVDWDLGAIWMVDEKAGVLRCTDVWSSPGVEAAPFVEMTLGTTMASGVGLPGRVWSTGEAAWIADVLEDANFPRAKAAAAARLHGAFCFPILINNAVCGVLEFFSREPRRPDEVLLQAMADMGIKIGLFIERSRADAERERLLEELGRATARVETLKRFLPLCAPCRELRDREDRWEDLETGTGLRPDPERAPAACRDCGAALYPARTI